MHSPTESTASSIDRNMLHASSCVPHLESSAGTTVSSSDDAFGEPSANAVNVEDAISEYKELKRELSLLSRESASQDSKWNEKGSTGFNLDAFLTGMRRDQDAAGFKPKQLGITWKNLTVEGMGTETQTIPTLYSYAMSCLKVWRMFGIGLPTGRKTILKPMTGFCKEGEMLLVLGRPGSGCTTLLRVLANVRTGYTAIGGDVRYGGIDPQTFAKRYRGQVVYNDEEDHHHTMLTVSQTLRFALRLKTPGKRLPQETQADFVNKIIYMLGSMLGLTRQMDTMVGNAFIRGLSGGERKRLSIAEVMTTQSSITCWDCATRGLDAASALDYVRSLRVMTTTLRKTTVAALYQASNSIFELFDKVLLLDQGYCIYFGPSSTAKAYFHQLGFYCPPRKSTPDFLTSVCNPQERQILPGYEKHVPRSPLEFQERYLASSVYTTMLADMAAYEAEQHNSRAAEAFEEAMKQEHQKYASVNDPYIASFWRQVQVLIIRQYHLNLKNYPELVCRYGIIFFQAIIMASCFYSIPHNGTGAFSRNGAMFTALMFNTFISETQLLGFFFGRPVLEKHRQFGLFRPSAHYMAQVVMDIPYALLQVLVFEICSYFMMALRRDVTSFFVYATVLFGVTMTMIGLFRLFGAVLKSFVAASQGAGVMLFCIMTSAGYIVRYQDMHPWLAWLHWINPVAYGYKALLINEMAGQTYSCEGPGNAVPYGPGYDDWHYKVCTMRGSKMGENVTHGTNYLLDYVHLTPSQLWIPNILAIFVLFILVTVIVAVSLEWSDLDKAGNLKRLYLPGKAPRERNSKEERLRQKKHELHIPMDTPSQKLAQGTTFSWQHVNYTIRHKGKLQPLLTDISGYVKPGHLTALMGSSGAGKTTLLDVLARRKTMGKTEGRLYMNGQPLMDDFERITAYCEQHDIHQPAATVRETLQFSAQLRQEESIPLEEKNAYVEMVLELLEMQDIADAQVGSIESGYGISVEELKRLTIATELVGRPQLLFLDEPTSGLDAQSSYNIVRFLRKLADAGWPVLCTIHQPSAILFEHFDHLLLLVHGGRTAYYGEIGVDAQTVLHYFESNGAPKCLPDANPAEYILNVVAGYNNHYDWAEIWSNSKQARALKEELDMIHQTVDMNPQRPVRVYATSGWTQLKLVYSRMALSYWRSPDYNLGRFFNVMVTALLNGFTFWKLGQSVTDMINRQFALFASFILALTIITLAQPKFMTERHYFRREYASRYYHWFPWGISVIAVEIPYILFLSFSMMCGFYWTAGLHNTFHAVGYFYLMFVCVILWAVTLGFILAAIVESPLVAAVFNPLVMSLLILFSGLMQPPAILPPFWRSWMYLIDPFHYYLEGLITNEMANVPVLCRTNELLELLAPPNTTCGAYMMRFFESGAPGYLIDPDIMQPEPCQYCPFKSGKEYYRMFGWSETHKWRNIVIIMGFTLFNIVCFIFLVYYKRKAQR